MAALLPPALAAALHPLLRQIFVAGLDGLLSHRDSRIWLASGLLLAVSRPPTRSARRLRIDWKRLERVTEILWPRTTIRHP